MVLAATPNLVSSGLIRRSSTATIDIDIMALMLCPSPLSVPTLMGHFFSWCFMIDGTVHVEEVRCGVGSCPVSILIRTFSSLKVYLIENFVNFLVVLLVFQIYIDICSNFASHVIVFSLLADY